MNTAPSCVRQVLSLLDGCECGLVCVREILYQSLPQYLTTRSQRRPETIERVVRYGKQFAMSVDQKQVLKQAVTRRKDQRKAFHDIVYATTQEPNLRKVVADAFKKPDRLESRGSTATILCHSTGAWRTSAGTRSAWSCDVNRDADRHVRHASKLLII